MGETIRIIGIDPGLRHTGWGVIEVTGNNIGFVASGTVHPPVEGTLSERLVALHDALDAVVSKAGADEAAVEQTFVNRDAAATLKLGQARGIALLVPGRMGLSVAEYAPNAVKKAIVGAGHAGQETDPGDGEGSAAEGDLRQRRRGGRAGDRALPCASPWLGERPDRDGRGRRGDDRRS